MILALIAEAPRHGYDLIKEIDERTGGAYSPSPGVIYPTLAMLEEMGHATVTESESNCCSAWLNISARCSAICWHASP